MLLFAVWWGVMPVFLMFWWFRGFVNKHPNFSLSYKHFHGFGVFCPRPPSQSLSVCLLPCFQFTYSCWFLLYTELTNYNKPFIKNYLHKVHSWMTMCYGCINRSLYCPPIVRIMVSIEVSLPFWNIYFASKIPGLLSCPHALCTPLLCFVFCHRVPTLFYGVKIWGKPA